ncbi:hypothetical protein [Photobacterium leiognathi]|uniref:hypothetical protein n=1 Tax=Photobacterium leiognathi TaxID=553611 RepID=UPI002981080B|nr:hypothetical protein [Photobacterium leiognathi]
MNNEHLIANSAFILNNVTVNTKGRFFQPLLKAIKTQLIEWADIEYKNLDKQTYGIIKRELRNFGSSESYNYTLRSAKDYQTALTNIPSHILSGRHFSSIIPINFRHDIKSKLEEIISSSYKTYKNEFKASLLHSYESNLLIEHHDPIKHTNQDILYMGKPLESYQYEELLEILTMENKGKFTNLIGEEIDLQSAMCGLIQCVNWLETLSQRFELADKHDNLMSISIIFNRPLSTVEKDVILKASPKKMQTHNLLMKLNKMKHFTVPSQFYLMSKFI